MGNCVALWHPTIVLTLKLPPLSPFFFFCCLSEWLFCRHEAKPSALKRLVMKKRKKGKGGEGRQLQSQNYSWATQSDTFPHPLSCQ